ncbi:LAP1 [Candida oxycetoniae]|uniref:Peptide hydrolase n=1 Tax=Candida oxycetoniae TaxID=497107 RepID=A0AAI9T198_9ASCO|nr:LAP1 [Candida oxycetoniae]KAI3407026.2 LAP1 [Candida oxycetoniae]
MRSIIILTTLISLCLVFPIFDNFPQLSLLPQSLYCKNRLIKLAPNEYRLVSEDEKLNLKRRNQNFIDMTGQIPIDVAVEQGLVTKPVLSVWQKVFLIGSKQITSLKKTIPIYNYPKSTKYNNEINKLFALIDVDFMLKKLTKFTSFYSRYYRSESGSESANWLHGQVLKLVGEFKQIQVKKIHHDGWDQFSIIVSIPGEVKDKVVVGAHQDSANLILPSIMKAPGADDDGSGSITILESLRLILEAYANGSFKPYNTLEFHWYSAEEGGLLGSIDVFSRYSNASEVVVGMLQQDMTGYVQGTIDAGVEPHFGLISDYTSVELNNFLKLIIKAYNSIPYHESKCGYACSDHASALENGYPSSFLIESEMKYSNKYIHSVMDTIDRLDWDHIKEHVKLTVAYAYELSSAKDLH